ncbi:MAG: RimK family alpha-L-glutamate ligase, partial [Gemmataceae bacterium]
MHLAILSSGSGWHVTDVQRACLARGFSSSVVDFRQLAAWVGREGVETTEKFDAILVRTMPPGSLEQVVFRMDLLHMAQEQGVLVFNSPRCLESAIDKYLTTARLSHVGLPVPSTFACQTAEKAMEAFGQLGKDVIVKPLFGSEGRGMVRISDMELAWRTFRTLERTGAVLYLQQMIRHPGWDLRLFVIGGKVQAAMKRHANNDWRTNVAQGGRGECFLPEGETTQLALKAAEVLGADAAGIDLIQGPGGEWYILEINAVPGWRAL